MFIYIMAQGTSLYSSTLHNILSMTTTAWILKHEEIIVIPLVLLLSLKEILPKSNLWSKPLATSLDAAIYPLLLIYGIVIFFKVAHILKLQI